MNHVNRALLRLNVGEVNWSIVAEKIRGRTLMDCKNKFMQLFEYALKEDKKRDKEVVRFLRTEKVTEEIQIDWSKWRSSEIVEQ